MTTGYGKLGQGPSVAAKLRLFLVKEGRNDQQIQVCMAWCGRERLLLDLANKEPVPGRRTHGLIEGSGGQLKPIQGG